MNIGDKLMADPKIWARLYFKHAHKPWVTDVELKRNIKYYINGKD